MRIPSPVCWIRALWYWVTCWPPIPGHSYHEVETHDNCHVQVLKCHDCGHVSLSWEKR